MKYEVFCDESYYDQWAVRPIGERRWGHCYHLPSSWEAERLAKELEERDRLRAALVPLLRHRPDGDIGWRGQKKAKCGWILVADILRIEAALGREYADAARAALEGGGK